MKSIAKAVIFAEVAVVPGFVGLEVGAGVAQVAVGIQVAGKLVVGRQAVGTE